jgi:hypothetical protein
MSIVSSLFLGVVFLLAGLMLSISGCASPGIEAYEKNTPKVDIKKYFNGKLIAFGTVQDFSGKVVSRFSAEIIGSFSGNTGTMDETFTYEDGTTEKRFWSFDIAEDGSFIGTAHDVIGKAKGRQAGNAIFMEYVLRRTINGRTMDFTMDDRLYQIDETHVMNQTKMKKFGITVAELNIGFYKVSN